MSTRAIRASDIRNRDVRHYVTTLVDDNVDYSSNKFLNKVKKVLTDKEGWEKVANVKFVFVNLDTFKKLKTTNKIFIRLTTNATISRECGFDIKEKLSCCDMISKNVLLNFSRWRNGAPASKLTLYKYRDYMINHEVGHALGRLHATCPCPNCPAPIMMQHTITIGKCSKNNKPLKGE